MAIFPQSVHRDEEAYPAGKSGSPTKRPYDLHFFATARLASAEKGWVMLEAAVDWLAARIETLIR
jgi:creatinine amidohydrolase/Fe(II)-dependent formamide hydrolase-like protein